jgi:hypothetical protein
MPDYFGHDWNFQTELNADEPPGCVAVATCAGCGLVQYRQVEPGDTVPPTLPGSCPMRPKPGLLARCWAAIKTAPGLVTIVGSILALVVASYTVNPNLAPASARSVELKAIGLEDGVSFRKMFAYPYARTTLPTGACAPSYSAPSIPPVEAADADGIIVHYTLQFSGIRGKCISVRPVLIDADGARRLEGRVLSDAFDTSLRDSDLAAGALWASRDALTTERFIVRVEVSDDATDLRLTFMDSGPFCSLTLRPCPDATRSPPN